MVDATSDKPSLTPSALGTNATASIKQSSQQKPPSYSLLLSPSRPAACAYPSLLSNGIISSPAASPITHSKIYPSLPSYPSPSAHYPALLSRGIIPPSPISISSSSSSPSLSSTSLDNTKPGYSSSSSVTVNSSCPLVPSTSSNSSLSYHSSSTSTSVSFLPPPSAASCAGSSSPGGAIAYSRNFSVRRKGTQRPNAAFHFRSSFKAVKSLTD